MRIVKFSLQFSGRSLMVALATAVFLFSLYSINFATVRAEEELATPDAREIGVIFVEAKKQAGIYESVILEIIDKQNDAKEILDIKIGETLEAKEVGFIVELLSISEDGESIRFSIKDKVKTEITEEGTPLLQEDTIKEKTEEPVVEEIVCSTEFNPVCANEGQLEEREFTNACEAQKNGILEFIEGKCKKTIDVLSKQNFIKKIGSIEEALAGLGFNKIKRVLHLASAGSEYAIGKIFVKQFGFGEDAHILFFELDDKKELLVAFNNDWTMFRSKDVTKQGELQLGKDLLSNAIKSPDARLWYGVNIK
jgi:hypothetical protein